jgi:hypothetical protein
MSLYLVYKGEGDGLAIRNPRSLGLVFKTPFSKLAYKIYF